MYVFLKIRSRTFLNNLHLKRCNINVTEQPFRLYRDETWLPERSGKPGGEERCAVRSRGVCWGKRVCRLAESSNLAGRQSGLGAGANFSATERAHKRNAGRIDAEWRRPGWVTKREMQRKCGGGVEKIMSWTTGKSSVSCMSESTGLQVGRLNGEGIQFDLAKHRQEWLRRLADEYIKLESAMPMMENFLPDEGCPKWVENIELEVGATMFPVAKLKEELKLTPGRLAAIIGHQCAIGVWLMEWLEDELEKPQSVDNAKLTPEQIQKGREILIKLTDDWYPALRRLAKRALCSCVDQPYDDMKEFLLAYAGAFAQKPTGPGLRGLGSSAFEIYNFMLFYWRIIDRLNSVHHLHETLVKVFGPYRTGDLKRTEKICQRIGLHYRKPGRPAKIKTIQTSG